MAYLVGGKSSATAYVTIDSNKYQVALPIRSESVNPRSNTITSEALLGNRAQKGATITSKTFQGSIDVELFDVSTSNRTHALLGFLAWLGLGSYDDTNKKVVLNTSAAAKLDYLAVAHGSSSEVKQWKDLYVTGLNFRFPGNGIPTATFDVLSKDEDSSDPSSTYTNSLIAVSDFKNYYTPANLSFTANSVAKSSQISNLELSLTQETLQANAWGSLNAAEITPSMLQMAQISLEFYVDSLTSGLFKDLHDVYASGAAEDAYPIEVDITSPDDGLVSAAKIAISKFYVTELSHDISGNDYIMARATIQVPADSLEFQNVDLNPAV